MNASETEAPTTDVLPSYTLFQMKTSFLPRVLPFASIRRPALYASPRLRGPISAWTICMLSLLAQISIRSSRGESSESMAVDTIMTSLQGWQVNLSGSDCSPPAPAYHARDFQRKIESNSDKIFEFRIRFTGSVPNVMDHSGQRFVSFHGATVFAIPYGSQGSVNCAMRSFDTTITVFIGGDGDPSPVFSLNSQGYQINNMWARIESLQFLGSFSPCDFSCPSSSSFGVMCNRYGVRPQVKNSSVDWTLPWGLSGATMASESHRGLITLKHVLPTNVLSKRLGLDYQCWPNSTCDVIRSTNAAGPALRQIRGTEGLADINDNPTNAHKFHIRCFAPTNVLNKVAGLWETTNAPYVTFTFWNPAENNTNFTRLLIIEDKAGLLTTNDFQWVSTNSAWTLFTGNNAARDRKALSTNAGVVTETRDLAAGNAQALQEVRRFGSFGFGQPIIEHTLAPGATNEIKKTWTYITNAAESAYGQIREARLPGGGWENFQHDSAGRLSRVLRPFAGQGPTDDTNLCRAVYFDYAPLAGSTDSGNDTNRARTTVECLLGKEVARYYLVLLDDEERQIRCQTPGALYTASNNLVTVTRRYTSGAFSNLLHSVRRPDGTMELYLYATNSTYRTNTVMIGQPNSGGATVTNGTRTVTVLGMAGETISETVSDIASGIVLEQQVFSNFDELHRARRVTHLDGTTTEVAYSCCGAESTTDRDGATTTYSYDSLGRIQSEERLGLLTVYGYDASGRILSKTRYGTNAAPIYLERNGYDLAGRLIAVTNAVGHVTRTDYYVDSNGHSVVATLLPGGGTRIETRFGDGQLASLVGTSVAPVRYEYGVAQDGLVWRSYIKEIRLDAGYEDTPEVRTNFVDMLGNTYKTIYADGTYEVTSYNNVGQMTRQRDPDGLITRFGYNSLGEREYSATDVAPSGAEVIDFAWDRISRTFSEVTTNSAGVPVRRSLTYGWLTNGSTNGTLLTTSETSTDGLRGWNSSFGLTNTTVTAYATNGLRYSTNTAPDGSKTITTFRYGLSGAE